ncbi:hypothetical protein PL78_02045 [Yersinia entomophaga]|uniref:Uncharacterized protein n=1 Tax=Yersinia entomophaga TaxID=935293 RepID=A0ABM6BH01_YERET|nr:MULTISPECIES: hypothetical protein [Yersinia]ANI28618.1 hypothetical protein PL78_02045 [Yersinia entomophaga]OWF89836.1 hypothetical protein B4914_03020 [Yersinia entomophaga]
MVFYIIGILYATFMISVGIYEINLDTGESQETFYRILLVFSGSIIVVAFIWSLLHRLKGSKK